jgi:CelD/BcsL family acetyltransferase involved in cellulose biosynthesis
MSWDWQWRWWQCHKVLLNAKLFVLAAYGADGSLVGIAPFYRHLVKHKGGLRASRLELLGQAWRRSQAVFSEYLDIVVARGAEQPVLAAFGNALKEDRPWRDLVLGNTRPDALAAHLVSEHFSQAAYVRETDVLEAHATRVDGPFDAYLKRLDSSTRRKLWNHRKRLVDPALTFATATEVNAYLDRIDAYHAARWGNAHYVGIRRAFHSGLAAAMAGRGALRMSTLSSGGVPFSVVYNIRLNGTEYNLQAGFDSENAAGVSPGYLHLGYCIEQAHADGLTWFDFLAGEGRNRQYKADFQTTASSVQTLQVIRSLPLQVLYRAYDAFNARRQRQQSQAAES